MNLTLSVRAIEMHAEEFLILVGNIGSHALSSFTGSDRQDDSIGKKLQQVNRNFEQLIMNRLGPPNGSQHQDVIVPGKVFQGMRDERGRIPGLFFRRT